MYFWFVCVTADHFWLIEHKRSSNPILFKVSGSWLCNVQPGTGAAGYTAVRLFPAPPFSLSQDASHRQTLHDRCTIFLYLPFNFFSEGIWMEREVTTFSFLHQWKFSISSSQAQWPALNNWVSGQSWKKCIRWKWLFFPAICNFFLRDLHLSISSIKLLLKQPTGF